jgi:hypothetical protein
LWLCFLFLSFPFNYFVGMFFIVLSSYTMYPFMHAVYIFRIAFSILMVVI